jgi:hypothetical protein
MLPDSRRICRDFAEMARIRRQIVSAMRTIRAFCLICMA